MIDRHNGNALIVIRACLKTLPDADSIAFFDSSFHSTMPDYVAKYAINPDVAEPKGLRKYGFHGLSCAFLGPLRFFPSSLFPAGSAPALPAFNMG